MSFQLTYAGVPLSIPTPEIISWINAALWQDHLQETMPRRSYPGRNLQNLATPFPGFPPRPFLNPGDFFYPTGVSRWGEYHGIVTWNQLTAILNIVYPGPPGSSTSLPVSAAFTIADDGSTDPNHNPNVQSPGVTTLMYLLPPKPLSQVLDNVQQDLYLITLVDERYYFATRFFSFFGDPTTDKTWRNLIDSLVNDLGITFDYPDDFDTDVVPYGLPEQLESSFWSTFESTPSLLDAAAWNVGCTIQRNIDGTYSMDFIEDVALNSNDTPFTFLPTQYPRPVAGGSIIWQPTFGGILLGPNFVLPNTVSVIFPFYLEQVGYTDTRHFIPNVPFDSPREVYDVNIAISSLGNPFAQYTGSNFAVIHDTARAYFSDLNAANPDNLTTLQTLAQNLAKDFCSNLLLGYDVNLPHIVALPDENSPNFQPQTLHDVIWTLRSDFASTRIFRKPWNLEAPQMQHHFPPKDYTGALHTEWEGPNAQPGTQVLYTSASADSVHYSRMAATLQRWSASLHTFSPWKSVWAVQLASNYAVGHWVGWDTPTSQPVYAFDQGALTGGTGGGGGGGTGPLDWMGYRLASAQGSLLSAPYYWGGLQTSAILTGFAIGVGSGTALALPFLSTSGGVVDQMGFYSNNTPASASVRLGIYDNIGTRTPYPHNLIVDAGSVVITGPGGFSVPVTATLSGNTLYWLILQPAWTGTPIPQFPCYAVGAGAFWAICGTPTLNESVGTQTFGWLKALGTPLPSTYPSGATPLNFSTIGAQCPSVAIRFSS